MEVAPSSGRQVLLKIWPPLIATRITEEMALSSGLEGLLWKWRPLVAAEDY